MYWNEDKTTVSKEVQFIKAPCSIRLIEFGKITWPQRQHVFVETVYVVIICFVFTLAILIMDLIFKGLLSFLK